MGDGVALPPSAIPGSATALTGTQAESTATAANRRYVVAFAVLVVATAVWVWWTQWKDGFHNGNPENDFGSSPLLGWIGCIVLLAAYAMLIGHAMAGRLDGLFIDARNRISLARVQVSLWTMLILSAFLTAGLWRIANGTANPLDIAIPKEVWALFGVSITSGVGAALIKIQMGDDMATNDDPSKASWSDQVRGDPNGNEARVDLSKVQMLYFTAIVVLGYAVGVGHLLVDAKSFAAFPGLNETIVYLLVISHAGYLTYKQLATPGPTGEAQGAGGGN
jgi:hypothetical protein